MSAVRRVLENVLGATPEPPKDADPADLLRAAEEMVLHREVPLEHLRAVLGSPPRVGEDGAPLLDELRRTDARWAAAIDCARRQIAGRIQAVDRLRQARRR